MTTFSGRFVYNVFCISQSSHDHKQQPATTPPIICLSHYYNAPCELDWGRNDYINVIIITPLSRPLLHSRSDFYESLERGTETE